MSTRQSDNYVWSVTELIGQGATGNVFICRDKGNGKSYAAKVFNIMGQMRTREVRKREIDLLRKLDHENIVTLVAEEMEKSTKATVLIMELCDTSLYNVLELPENYFGLSEMEFKSVLQDVVRGMKYLREYNIVHRDVKPGNILKTRSPTGRYVFKLTDFGAARQLNNADQSFVSIYGTEEYLHPDVYEKAVMKNFSRKKFTAAVDLWSMGVTFYHAATGQLPFRPYGGRQNKETMFEIISQKGPKIISGLQKANGGRIEYSDDLPEETRISKGLKILIRPVFQELLETTGEGLEKLITFDQLYKHVEDILRKKVIDVFCTNTSKWYKIYANESDNLKQLETLIAMQTDIDIESSQMFLSSERFIPTADRCVNTLPVIDKENPLIVVGGEAIESAKLYQRKIPHVPKMPSSKARHEDDIDVLKIYASICFVHMFCAEDFYFSLKTTQLTMEIIANIMNNIIDNVIERHAKIEGLKQLLDQATFKSNREFNQIKRISQLLRLNGSYSDINGDTPSDHRIKGEEAQQLSKLLEAASVVSISQKCFVLPTLEIEKAKNWMDEIRILSNDVNDIYMHISKDKCIARGTFEDLIYSAKRQQVIENLNTIRTIFVKLAEVRQSCHTDLNKWLANIKNQFVDVSNTQDQLKTADAIVMRLHSRDMNLVSTEKSILLEELQHLVEGHPKSGRTQLSDTSLSIMESEVSVLEEILHDIMNLVEEGDQKLMSSKEIFQELSNCNA